METKKRIESIDLLRGVVMVLMALDHTRDYFHYDAFFFEPTDLSQSNPAFFWTRFITHYCAPVFVFLAGTSAFFVGQRRDKKSLSIWLIKRGVWLIFVELTIIKIAWYFKMDFAFFDLQVIWALGACMIFLAGFIHLPKKLVISVCLIGILTHNAFDNFYPTGDLTSALWVLFHNAFNQFPIGGSTIFVSYPLIPWIFVMPLGYYFGSLYMPNIEPTFRVKRLIQVGFGLTLLFVLFRYINVYGDPYFWSKQNSFSFTLMSFFNVTKYPPSLFYLMITLGPSLIFLGYAEKWRGKFVNAMVVIGRVPMFFYIIHIYIIHGLAALAAMMTGFGASSMSLDTWITETPGLQGFGFSLWVVYLIWLILMLGLYPVCKWYNNYKSNNRDKWWLSYL